MADKIRVAVAGAAGRMGRAAVRAVAAAPDMTLAAALGRERGVGQDAGTVAGTAPLGVTLTAELADILDAKPDVLIEFSPGAAAAEHARVAIPAGVRPVIGATGIGQQDRSEEHTSELQSLTNLVCRLLLEKKKQKKK